MSPTSGPRNPRLLEYQPDPGRYQLRRVSEGQGPLLAQQRLPEFGRLPDLSPKQDVAATAKLDYKFSDRTSLTVIGSHIILDAFNNNDPTRRQLLTMATTTSTTTPNQLGLRIDLQVLLRSAVLALLDLPRPQLLRCRYLQPRLRQGLEAGYQVLHLRLLQPPALSEQHRPGSGDRLAADHRGQRGCRR